MPGAADFCAKSLCLFWHRMNPMAAGMALNPAAMKADAASKEIEEAMKRVREAQSLISAAIEPGSKSRGTLICNVSVRQQCCRIRVVSEISSQECVALQTRRKAREASTRVHGPGPAGGGPAPDPDTGIAPESQHGTDRNVGSFFDDGTCCLLGELNSSVCVCVYVCQAIEKQVQAALAVQEPAALPQSPQEEVSLQGPRQTLTEQVQV